MRNASDKSCGENKNTFMLNNFFQKSCRFGDVEDDRAREDTDDNTAHAHGMLDNYGYTHSEYVMLFPFLQQ